MSGQPGTALRRRAMDLLARRERSRCELERGLRERFPDAAPEIVQDVLAGLAAENLQSDRRFAAEYLRARMERGCGWLQIRASLLARGIDEELIEELARSDEEWLERARKLAGSRLKRKPRLAPRSREHRRLFLFLTRRGFSSEIAHRALHEFFEPD